MTKFTLALLALATAVAMSPAAMADTMTDINWVKNGTNKLNGSATWTSAMTPATSWTQVGTSSVPTLNLAITGLTWNPNQGESGNQSHVTGALGTPSLDSNVASTITVTDGGGLFAFDSVDTKNTAAAGGETYTIKGYTGTPGDYVLAFTLSCSSESRPPCPTGTTYSTIAGEPTDWITELVISETPFGGYSYWDYLDLTSKATPEPNSLLLLGTGLLGLCVLVRRKVATR